MSSTCIIILFEFIQLFFIRIYTSFHLSSIPHISHICMPTADMMETKCSFFEKKKKNSKHTHTTTTNFESLLAVIIFNILDKI